MARMRNPRTIQCQCCGKIFVTLDAATKYCSKPCKNKAYSAQQKANRIQKQSSKKKKNNMNEIIEIEREAKQHGMSYGQYVLYLQENKNAKI